MLYEDLGLTSDTGAAEKILNGPYIPDPGTDDFVVHLLLQVAEVAAEMI